MPRYHINAAIAGSKYIGDVDAENAEDAIFRGYEMKECFVSVCHQCSRQIEDPEVISLSATNADDPSDFKDDRP